jgi:uncharacterized MAPEG superfamily protein
MTLPLGCIGIAFLLVYLPKLVSSLAMSKMPGGYDNKEPRAQQAKLAGWGARAHAAHLNGFEAFAPFAAAVLVAVVAHADPKWTNILALTHVGARTVYPFIYLANLGTLRSAIWTVGFGATLALFALPLFTAAS